MMVNLMAAWSSFSIAVRTQSGLHRTSLNRLRWTTADPPPPRLQRVHGTGRALSMSTSSTTKSGDPRSENTSQQPKKVKTPIGKLDELEEGQHPYREKEPLKPFPNNTNPETGEIGGPRGPEPTRYGDWERKGRVTDF